jgi:CheY-like chemotaxis protein
MAGPVLDILVVDHDPWAANVLEPTLRRYGHGVRIAGSEADALRLFAAQRPQITCVDLSTGEGGPGGIVRQLRKQDARASIIGLTAMGGEPDLTPARDLGVTEFLTKAPLPRAARASGSPATVLIVDDEPTIAALLARFLSARGYRAEGVCSAPDALDRVAAAAPDAILLDLFMPGMNGLELLRTLHARHFSGALLALSAAHDDALLRRVAECGPVHVVGKPVDLDRLGLALQIALALAPAAGR